MAAHLTRDEGSPLRVAVLSPSAELGGAERSLLTFLKAAPARNVEATVVLPREGPLGGELSAVGVPWDTVPQPRAFASQSRGIRAGSAAMMLPLTYQGPFYLLRLAAVIRRLRAHVLYTNGTKCHLLALALRPFLRLRTVWHIRDFWEGTVAGHLADLGPNMVIANSRATADALSKTMKARGKVVVVHNAVDSNEFHPHGPTADVGGNEGATVALPAAFAQWKGHELFLRAAVRVRAELPATRFFLVGGAIYDTVAERGLGEKLRKSVAQWDLTDSVVFTGFQSRMAPWYRAVDVVVNASVRPEPFGRALLEAMACGRAVVGPRAGGVPEFIEHGRNGLLYEMGNAEALADATLLLLRRPALRQQLGRAGRETAVTRFTPDAHAKQIALLLRRAANGGAPPGA